MTITFATFIMALVALGALALFGVVLLVFTYWAACLINFIKKERSGGASCGNYRGD